MVTRSSPASVKSSWPSLPGDVPGERNPPVLGRAGPASRAGGAGGSALGRTKLSWVAFSQPLQDRGGLQSPLRVPPQQWFDGFVPDRLERVWTSAPGPKRLAFRRHSSSLSGTGAAHAHTGGGRSSFLSFSFHKLLPQSTYWLLCDHPLTPQHFTEDGQLFFPVRQNRRF